MWSDAGWPELLAEADVQTTRFALPGHDESPLEPDAPPADVMASISSAEGAGDILIGFSAGATLALRSAAADPDRFRSVVLLGFGDGMWTSPANKAQYADQVRDGDDAGPRMLRRMAAAAGNNIESVARFISVDPGPPSYESLARITGTVLIVLGANDPAGPADQVARALPNARVVTLPGVDHFRTPTEPGAMAAVLAYLMPGRPS
jgi:pimeloyl-ACP methyl ester carboxylesterase